MKIYKPVVEKIIAHARRAAPIEACGYLAAQKRVVALPFGQAAAQKRVVAPPFGHATAHDGVVTASYELTNIDRSADHFSFDPKEQFAAMKEARSQEFEIVGVYHSHPATPARPSAEDIKLAYDPAMLYVIVSVAGKEADVKAFRIKNGVVKTETLEVV